MTQFVHVLLEPVENEGLPSYLIALIVIASVILFCSLCLFIFILFNGWIVEDGKAIRVFKFFGIKRKGKYLLIVFPFTLKYREASEIYSTKRQALKEKMKVDEKENLNR